MKFWDSSAIVPLLVDEETTASMRQVLIQDPAIAVWLFTGVELLSALGRLGRQSAALNDLLPGLRADVSSFLEHVVTVTDIDGVRRRAERLVGLHPLASADAMQLAAALVAAGDRPETLAFVTLDRQLGRSAQLEGFRTIGG